MDQNIFFTTSLDYLTNLKIFPQQRLRFNRPLVDLLHKGADSIKMSGIFRQKIQCVKKSNLCDFL